MSIKQHLMTGEELVFTARRHCFVVLKPLLWLAFLFLFIPYMVESTFLVIGVPIFMGCCCFTIAEYLASVVVITTNRVWQKEGIFGHRVSDTYLRKIEGVDLEQSLCGQLFGYGTVRTTGTGGRTQQLECVLRPQDFRQRLMEAIEGYESGVLLEEQTRTQTAGTPLVQGYESAAPVERATWEQRTTNQFGAFILTLIVWAVSGFGAFALGVLILKAIIRHAPLTNEQVYALPKCDDASMAAQLTDVMARAPQGPFLGLKITELEDVRLIRTTDKTTTCAATAHLSNATRVGCNYSLSQNKDGYQIDVTFKEYENAGPDDTEIESLAAERELAGITARLEELKELTTEGEKEVTVNGGHAAEHEPVDIAARREEREAGARSSTERSMLRKTSARLEVFVASKCPHCEQLEAYLNERYIPYKKYNLEKQPKAERDYLVNIGRGILPVTRLGGDIIRGFDRQRLDRWIRIKQVELEEETKKFLTTRSGVSIINMCVESRAGEDVVAYSKSDVRKVHAKNVERCRDEARSVYRRIFGSRGIPAHEVNEAYVEEMMAAHDRLMGTGRLFYGKMDYPGRERDVWLALEHTLSTAGLPADPP